MLWIIYSQTRLSTCKTVVSEPVEQRQLENTKPNIAPISDILCSESSQMNENKKRKKERKKKKMKCVLVQRRQKKEADSRLCVIKAPLLEHMLAQTNIHARHNLAIRGGF